MSHKYSELKEMFLDELTKQHEKSAEFTVVGVSYYLDEIRRQEQSILSEKLERYTAQIWWFTLVATIATVLGALFAAYSL